MTNDQMKALVKAYFWLRSRLAPDGRGPHPALAWQYASLMARAQGPRA